MRIQLELPPGDVDTLIKLLEEKLRRHERSDENRRKRGDLPEWWDPRLRNRRNRALLERLRTARKEAAA